MKRNRTPRRYKIRKVFYPYRWEAMWTVSTFVGNQYCNIAILNTFDEAIAYVGEWESKRNV